MYSSNNKNVFWAFKDIHFISRFIGLFSYNLPLATYKFAIKLQKTKKIVTQFVIYFLLLAYYVYRQYLLRKNSRLLEIVEIIITQGSICYMTILNVIKSFKRSKEILEVLFKINEIDVHIPEKYRTKAYKNTRKIFFVIFIIEYSCVLIISIIFLIILPEGLLSVFLFLIGYIIDSVVECQLLFIFYVLKEKLIYINKKLVQKKTNTNNLKILINMYYNCFDTSNKLENIYGLHVINKFICSFVLEVVCSYYTIRTIKAIFYLILLMYMSLILLFNLTVRFIYYCNRVTFEVYLRNPVIFSLILF